MTAYLKLLRFALGVSLINLGVKALPEGRCRQELYSLLATWGEQVKAEVRTLSKDARA